MLLFLTTCQAGQPRTSGALQPEHPGRIWCKLDSQADAFLYVPVT